MIVLATTLALIWDASPAPSAPSGSTGGGIDPTGGLLSYGVLGIVVVALITGLLVPGYLYKKTEAENDRLRKMSEQIYTALAESTAVTREAQQTMREVVTVLAQYEVRQQAARDREDDRPAPRPRKRTTT
jgi:hypothetical protein